MYPYLYMYPLRSITAKPLRLRLYNTPLIEQCHETTNIQIWIRRLRMIQTAVRGENGQRSMSVYGFLLQLKDKASVANFGTEERYLAM